MIRPDNCGIIEQSNDSKRWRLTLKLLRHPAALLFCILAISTLLLASAGVVLKYSTARQSPQIQETLAIAVPFILVRGDVAVPEAPAVGSKGRPVPTAQPEKVPITGPDEVAPPEKEKPLWEFQAVEEDYFNNVLFVGDSRTEGLKLYGRLGTADYFANPGMSVFNLFDKVVGDQNFAAQSLSQLLASKEYEAIYLMLGINEVGYPRSSLDKQFAKVVKQIRELQPNAALVLQGNLGVTRNKAAKQDYFSPANINALNEMIAALADEKTIFYLPPATIFSDEEGYLQSDITGDGVHPYAAEYLNWAAWLKNYGLVRTKDEAVEGPKGEEESAHVQVLDEVVTEPENHDTMEGSEQTAS